MSPASKSMTSRLALMRDSVTDFGRTTTPRLTWYEIRMVAGVTLCFFAIAAVFLVAGQLASPDEGRETTHQAQGRPAGANLFEGWGI